MPPCALGGGVGVRHLGDVGVRDGTGQPLDRGLSVQLRDEVLPGLVGVEALGEHGARGHRDGPLTGVPGPHAAERADHGQDGVGGWPG